MHNETNQIHWKWYHFFFVHHIAIPWLFSKYNFQKMFILALIWLMIPSDSSLEDVLSCPINKSLPGSVFEISRDNFSLTSALYLLRFIVSCRNEETYIKNRIHIQFKMNFVVWTKLAFWCIGTLFVNTFWLYDTLYFKSIILWVLFYELLILSTS